MTRPARPVQLICELTEPLPPQQVIAESRALLAEAGAGGPETLRLFRVRECVAFGPKDERALAFARAVGAARAAGFDAVRRIEGGRAIAVDSGTLGIAWTIPDSEGRAHIRPRFSLLAAIAADALRAVGVDARVGTVPGEYCPGDFSVGARDAVKLVGLGQRVTAGAVHVGAFVVVDGASRLRSVLGRVYEALGIDWDPRSLGSVSGEVGRTVTPSEVGRHVIEAAARYLELVPVVAQAGGS